MVVEKVPTAWLVEDLHSCPNSYRYQFTVLIPPDDFHGWVLPAGAEQLPGKNAVSREVG